MKHPSKLHLRSTALLMLAVVAQSVYAELPSVCSAEYADSLRDAKAFRTILDMCDLESKGYARALYRLNTLPPPTTALQLALRTRVPGVEAQRTVLEVDVFFNWLEAYPVDLGLTKLDELVAMMNRGFALEQVQVVGSMDAMETRLPNLRVAERRAEFLRKYFVAAGAAAPIVVASTTPSAHPNTPEGRARDRSVAVRVVMLRQRVDALQNGDASAASWAYRVGAAVRRNIVWAGEGNPRSEVEVGLASDGVIEDVTLVRGSGDQSWDAAVLAAVRKTGHIPLDSEGKTPKKMVMVFQPKIP